jgi:DNA end-binding protein Ku
MAHALWTGTINFGLVTIPVKLFTAVRENSDLHFHLLHKKDQGRIKNERVCSECGKKVAWDDIERGYEYEKGQFVVVTDDDFKHAAVEATQSVDIVEFVELSEIDPMLFDKPYYLEPEKRGRHAYALLRAALAESGKVGVARVVIRSREHIAAVKPSGNALIMEVMRWADEIVSPSSLELPKPSEKLPAPELKAAHMLIDAMSNKFDVSEFKDTYRAKLLETIEAKAAGTPAPKVRAKAPPKANVIDLVEVLQKSLDARKGRNASSGAARSSEKRAHRHGKKSAA